MANTPTTQRYPTAQRCDLLEDATHRAAIIRGLSEQASRLELVRPGDVKGKLADHLLVALGAPGARSTVLAYIAYQVFSSEAGLVDLFSFGNFEPSASYTHHPSGRVARPEEIVRASGFEDFNSRGGVVYLDKLEVVVDGQGYGKELLARFLDKPEFGLVFLHARDRFAYQYFLKQGFVDSRIKSGDDTVMVFTRDA